MAKNPLWEFVTEREDGLGLSVDVGMIVAVSFGAIIGTLTDIGILIIQTGWRIARAPLAVAGRIITGIINVISSVLPVLIDESARETAMSLEVFGIAAFPLALVLGVLLVALVLAYSSDAVGGVLFG